MEIVRSVADGLEELFHLELTVDVGLIRRPPIGRSSVAKDDSKTGSKRSSRQGRFPLGQLVVVSGVMVDICKLRELDLG